VSEPVFLPLMREDQPDTAERVRRQVQAIEWALPERKYCGEMVPLRVFGKTAWERKEVTWK
jgi:hypothetical protein